MILCQSIKNQQHSTRKPTDNIRNLQFPPKDNGMGNAQIGGRSVRQKKSTCCYLQ